MSELISMIEAAKIAEVTYIGFRTWTDIDLLTVHRVAGHPAIDKRELEEMLQFRKKMNNKKWKKAWKQVKGKRE